MYVALTSVLEICYFRCPESTNKEERPCSLGHLSPRERRDTVEPIGVSLSPPYHLVGYSLLRRAFRPLVDGISVRPVTGHCRPFFLAYGVGNAHPSCHDTNLGAKTSVTAARFEMESYKSVSTTCNAISLLQGFSQHLPEIAARTVRKPARDYHTNGSLWRASPRAPAQPCDVRDERLAWTLLPLRTTNVRP